MRKKNRFFSFLLGGLILLIALFFISHLLFPEEAPKKQASPPAQELAKKAGIGEKGKTEPVITQPAPDPFENADREEEGGKADPPHQQENTEPPHQQETTTEWETTMLEKLSFLQMPLPGASVTTRDSQLPGAPRPYRNGVHEGLDFYSGYCGREVNFGDQVFAAGPGVVYRIDHAYAEPAVEERAVMLQKCVEEGDTPAEILDKLRGRQVWVAHPHGVVTRYAHLSAVAEHLQEGDPVSAGDLLGNVGNSGTSEGARGEKTNSHLHFEIWLADEYLGKGLAPEEIRRLWQTLLENNN